MESRSKFDAESESDLGFGLRYIVFEKNPKISFAQKKFISMKNQNLQEGTQRWLDDGFWELIFYLLDCRKNFFITIIPERIRRVWVLGRNLVFFILLFILEKVDELDGMLIPLKMEENLGYNKTLTTST